MAIVSSLFIRWGITKFKFRAYIVQFDGDSNSVKSSLINLFRRRISIYSPSHQMTIYMLLSSRRVANVELQFVFRR